MNKFEFRKAHSRECRALDFQDLPFEEDVKATEKERPYTCAKLGCFDPQHFEAN